MEEPNLIYYIVPRQSGITTFCDNISLDLYPPTIGEDSRVKKSLFINLTRIPKKQQRHIGDNSKFYISQELINTWIYEGERRNGDIINMKTIMGKDIWEEMQNFIMSGQPIMVESTLYDREEQKARTISFIKYISKEHLNICKIREIEYTPIPVHWFDHIDSNRLLHPHIVFLQSMTINTLKDSALMDKVLPILRRRPKSIEHPEILELCKEYQPDEDPIEMFNLLQGVYKELHSNPVLHLSSEYYNYEIHDLTNTLSQQKRLTDFIIKSSSNFTDRLHMLRR